MRPFIKKSTRWLFPLYLALLITGWGVGLAAGIEFHSPPTRLVERPVVSNHATSKEVIANLDGKHVAGTGQYITGFECAAWTNGNKATDHGWVVYYCVK